MTLLQQTIDLFLHLDVHLAAVIAAYGALTYALLFAIIFCETGLVIAPFLPGDSLLFAAGAFAANGSLNVTGLFFLFIVAAVGGDALNYLVGAYVGPRVFLRWRLLKQEHLDRAHAFFERHGGKAIVFARFVPIVRTVAPFVAGVGRMTYRRFAMYNVAGAFIWVVLFLGAGYLFGNIPAVEKNFSVVILAIIVVSVLPGAFEYWRGKRKTLRSQSM